MTDNTVIQELKEVCNLIVGRWYSEKTGQELDFSFTDELLKSAPLRVLESTNKILDTVYIIGIFPTIELRLKTDFYFEIGRFAPETKYLIKSINKNKMQLSQLHYYDEIGNEMDYIRKTNLEIGEELLSSI